MVENLTLQTAPVVRILNGVAAFIQTALKILAIFHVDHPIDWILTLILDRKGLNRVCLTRLEWRNGL
jgi:hypothetical protein